MRGKSGFLKTFSSFSFLKAVRRWRQRWSPGARKHRGFHHPALLPSAAFSPYGSPVGTVAIFRV